ncbi:MAG: GldG family protein [Acidobacteria bacterium]|nr:GldG family protein [Acidobacteriota bacterium]
MNRVLKYIPSAGLILLLLGYLYYAIRSVWSIPAQVMVYGGAAVLVFSLFWHWEEIQKTFHRRAVRYGSAASAIILILLGILGLVNFLGYRHSKRFDLTENQLFSLSDQSKKVAQNLKMDVTVNGFFKDNAPSFADLMEEYRSAGKRIHYAVVDPQTDPGKAKEFGVQKFGDVVVTSGSKKERIESATEESITNAIIKVTREKNKTLYFMSGHGERDINSDDAGGLAMARQKLESQNYDVKTLTLATEKTIPIDAAVVAIVGPRFSLLLPEVEALQNYANQGGKILLLADPETKPGLESFLKPKGIELDDDVVLDVSGIGQLFGMGPAAPLITHYEGHPITEGFEGTMTFFPLSCSISTPSATEQGFSTQVLLKTNPSSWGETDLKVGSAKFDAGKDRQGPLNLGVAATKAIDDKQARMVVIGDSDFATTAYFGNQRNGDLFLNAVSWLAEDADLMAIRPRNPQSRRLNLSIAEANFLFYFAVVLMPGVALAAGIAVWWKRRS